MTTSCSERSALLLTVALLAGCGGGNGGITLPGGYDYEGPTSGTYHALDDTSAGTSALRYLAFDSSFNVETGTSSLDRGSGEITGDPDTFLDGTFNSARTSIALSGSGTATVIAGSDDEVFGSQTEYVRLFRTEGGTNYFGVLGVPSDVADLGTTADFRGRVVLFATTGSGSYDLSGLVGISADFDAGTIDSQFVSLSGQLNSTQSVSNVGTISIEGATLSGTAFTGGTATGTGIFDLSEAPDLTGTEGQFYGPGEEVGGLLMIDDTASDIQVLGYYTAD